MIFHCSKCGKVVQFDDNYCRFCGEKQNVEANMMKKRREEYRERDERVKNIFTNMKINHSIIYCSVKMGGSTNFYPKH